MATREACRRQVRIVPLATVDTNDRRMSTNAAALESTASLHAEGRNAELVAAADGWCSGCRVSKASTWARAQRSLKIVWKPSAPHGCPFGNQPPWSPERGKRRATSRAAPHWRDSALQSTISMSLLATVNRILNVPDGSAGFRFDPGAHQPMRMDGGDADAAFGVKPSPPSSGVVLNGEATVPLRATGVVAVAGFDARGGDAKSGAAPRAPRSSLDVGALPNGKAASAPPTRGDSGAAPAPTTSPSGCRPPAPASAPPSRSRSPSPAPPTFLAPSPSPSPLPCVWQCRGRRGGETAAKEANAGSALVADSPTAVPQCLPTSGVGVAIFNRRPPLSPPWTSVVTASTGAPASEAEAREAAGAAWRTSSTAVMSGT
mmetsp:Transcript_17526/g.48056  ORF Transcript_17526/g.48056 Transcript_17526/m.48056 type:complete len:374 (-) Transcript_17526:311-1432(-)